MYNPILGTSLFLNDDSRKGNVGSYGITLGLGVSNRAGNWQLISIESYF